jgi:protein O-mannosyl-transferase
MGSLERSAGLGQDKIVRLAGIRPVAFGRIRRTRNARNPMSPSDRSPTGDRKLIAWGVACFLVVVVGVIYGQTLWFGFVNYDDNCFVYACPEVSAGLTGHGIVWAFTDGPFGEWYPLSMISHMLDCQIYGLNAGGHHLTSALLHAATVVGLFLVLRNMTGELWPSAFVAALLAIHPQHVESVAWIAERRDVLSGLFFVLTLAAYVGYVRSGRTVARYVLVAVLLTLGLMSKAMLVTVPTLLLLLDYWPLGRFGSAARIPECNAALPRQSFWRLACEKLPLLAIAMGGCYMTLSSQGKDSPVAWSDRFANAAVASVTYLCQFFYPKDLAAYYPMPEDGYPAWKTVGAITVLTLTSAAAVAGCRRYPHCFVGWFWFLGTLAPVLGLVHIAGHAMADRYMYLPSIGLSVAVAWSAARLGAGSADGRWALGGSAVLVVAILVGCAIWQTSLWRDEVLLWTHSLAVTEDNAHAEIALADALNQAHRLDDAITHYRRATRWPVGAPVLNKLGLALAAQGRYPEAITEFRGLVQLDPNSALAYTNLGRALDLTGRPIEAADNYLRAIDLNPQLPQPYLLLGQLLLKAGRPGDAIGYFERLIALDRQNVPGRLGLAAALVGNGHSERAVAEYRLVLDLAPDDATAREALGKLLSGEAQPASR